LSAALYKAARVVYHTEEAAFHREAADDTNTRR
jgi:hypothetical protein